MRYDEDDLTDLQLREGDEIYIYDEWDIRELTFNTIKNYKGIIPNVSMAVDCNKCTDKEIRDWLDRIATITNVERFNISIDFKDALFKESWPNTRIRLNRILKGYRLPENIIEWSLRIEQVDARLKILDYSNPAPVQKDMFNDDPGNAGIKELFDKYSYKEFNHDNDRFMDDL